MKALILLLISCFISLGRTADPVVKIVETNPPTKLGLRKLVVHKDFDAYLDCVVDNKPTDKDVKWVAFFKDANGTTIPFTISVATSSMDPYKYQIDQPTAISWRLKLQHSQVTDEAQYACQVQIANQKYAQDFRHIRVIETPQIIDLQTSSDQTVDHGDKIDLRCNATGRPMPIIKWTRTAGGLLPTGGQEHVGNFLVKPASEPNDLGSFKCTASNEAGSDSRKVFLNVNFAPHIAPEDGRVGQAVGYRKELVCNIEAFPIPVDKDITWSRDGKALTFDEGYQLDYYEGAFSRAFSKVTIFSVQEYDFGQYQCTAKNKMGTGHAAVELFRTIDPTKDRTGRVCSAATLLSISMTTILMLLSICFLHRL